MSADWALCAVPEVGSQAGEVPADHQLDGRSSRPPLPRHRRGQRRDQPPAPPSRRPLGQRRPGRAHRRLDPRARRRRRAPARRRPLPFPRSHVRSGRRGGLPGTHLRRRRLRRGACADPQPGGRRDHQRSPPQAAIAGEPIPPRDRTHRRVARSPAARLQPGGHPAGARASLRDRAGGDLFQGVFRAGGHRTQRTLPRDAAGLGRRARQRPRARSSPAPTSRSAGSSS